MHPKIKIFLLFVLVMGLNIHFLTARGADKDYDDRHENVIADEWCEVAMDGKRTRFYRYKKFLAEVDCLTTDYAIEVENAPNWHQAPGQAIWYSMLWGKKPAIMVIVRSLKEEKYLTELRKLIKGRTPPVHYGLVASLKIRIFVVRLY